MCFKWVQPCRVGRRRVVFNLMKSFYGICPEQQHFSCMIDLLGSAGLPGEAEELLQWEPGGGDSVMWSSLLRSCRVHKNEIVGKRAAKVSMELGQEDFAIYLQVSNFYSEVGEFEASLQIREIAIARKVMREIGHSLIEENDLLPSDSLIQISFLAYEVAGNMSSDNFNILGELEDLDIAEEDAELFEIPSWTSECGGKVLVTVDSFGAVGDGVSDDTQTFRKAWDTACFIPKSVFLVPPERRYLVNATTFKGPCADRLVVQIDGTIVGPDEPKNWDPDLPRLWLDFSKLQGVVFQGNGPCRGAPTALTIDSSSSIKVKGLTIQNSQQMNFVISKSESVRVYEVQVSCPGDSPNTDGIHITGSTNVVLQDCKIGTEDKNTLNEAEGYLTEIITCVHTDCIGSLGKDSSTGIVTKVVFDTAFLRETTNGARIKTWQGGSGYVRGVRFKNMRMEDVANPIIIDQFYCDSPTTCQNQKKDGTVETYRNSAQGFGYGVVHPSADCLSSHDKGSILIDQKENAELAEPTADHIVHTEL
ncbi:hypothetical protein CRYUN_Cryun29cG0051000 [Craigia yunnanensis]